MAVLPIAHWNVVPRQEITGSFEAGVVATHKIGLDGVIFKEATPTATKRRATKITKNPRTTNFEYWTTIDSDEVGSGLKTFSATVWPRYPFTSSLAQYAPRVLSLILHVFPGGITYPATFYVDPTGGDDANPGTSGSPLKTIKKAVEAVTAAGAQNGGRILLRAGNYNETTAPSSDCIQTSRFLHIEADTASGASKANISISGWPSNGMRCTWLHLKNLTLLTGITTRSFPGQFNRRCWLDRVDAGGSSSSFSPTGTHTWVHNNEGVPGASSNGFGLVYWTGGIVVNSRKVQEKAQLLRGVAAGNIGEDAFGNTKCVVDCSVTGIAPYQPGVAHADVYDITGVSENDENFLVWGLRAFDLVKTQGIFIEKGNGSGNFIENVGFVNVLIEGDPSEPAGSQIHDLDGGWRVDHLVMEHVTIVGQDMRFRNQCRFYWINGCIFEKGTNDGGLQGPFGVQDLHWELRGLDNIHYIDSESTGAITMGRQVSIGPALFNNPASNDYRPGAGSPLFLGTHKLFRSHYPMDAAKSLRGQDKTAIGALRSTEEAPGGEAPPAFASPATAYDAPPAGSTWIVNKGSPITPIAPQPVGGGAPTKYRLLESIDQAYKPQPEVQADPDQAHFEVREFRAGDPTDPALPSPGHRGHVVVDLRFGHVYLRHPKMGVNDAFSPMAVAANLCAPHASDAGTYTNSDGPFQIPDGPQTTHGERPLIRVDGDITEIPDSPTGPGTNGDARWVIGNGNQGYAGGISSGGAKPEQIVSWAAVPGIGGFHPLDLSGDPAGKGQHIVLSIVGTNLGKSDRVFGPGVGGGINGDRTYAAEDVLFKQISFVKTDMITGAGSTNHWGFGQWGERTGRIRLYDHWLDNIDGQPLFSSAWVSKWGIRGLPAAHWDVRRCPWYSRNEHSFYSDGVNCGLLRGDVPGFSGSKDSWFIDNEQMLAAFKSMFQLTYRCADYGGPGSAFLGHQSAYPGPEGVVYFEGNRWYGSNFGTTPITLVGASESSLLLKGNEIHVEGDLVPHVTYTGELIFDQIRNPRGLLFWVASDLLFTSGDPQAGIYYSDAGFCCRELVVVSHFDSVGTTVSEKRIEFRGAGDVRIYDFEFLRDLGGTALNHALGIDSNDSGPGGTVAHPAGKSIVQYNHDGLCVYIGPEAPPGASGGNPLSINGANRPWNKSVRFYFNYPNPSQGDQWGYITFPQKVEGWHVGKGGPFQKENFTDAEIDTHLAATSLKQAFEAIGLDFDETTGVISGTPTGVIPEVDIPGQHPGGAPSTRFWVEASNGAGTAVGFLNLFVVDTDNQVVQPDVGEVLVEGLVPDVEIEVPLFTGEILVETPGLPTVSSDGGPEILVGLGADDVGEVVVEGEAPGVTVEFTVAVPIGIVEVVGALGDVGIEVEGTADGGPQGEVPFTGAEDGIGF